MRTFWVYFLSGTALCLSGLSSWFVWRKLSSLPFSTSSEEDIQQSLKEVKSVARRVEAEWESSHTAIVSILGRLDQAKRRDRRKAEEGQVEALQPQLLEGEDAQIGRLNQMVARRMMGS